jgi:peptide/nickel transport system ATP-binding protein
VLAVAGLSTYFYTGGGIVRSVDDVSFTLSRGEILGLVGESGSGKSVTGRSIMGLIRPPGKIVAGSIRLAGQELVGLGGDALRRLRGNRIATVFQDPMMTLNPVLRVDTQMIEAIRAHADVSKSDARARALAALAQVGIPAPAQRLRCYPHELSGGMRQRVAIAIALLNKPDVIIADEPTTALDVTIQGQILAEVQHLTRATGTALIWVSHDLGVVAGLADRIAVMYMGRIVELGPTHAVLSAPQHPYTRGLLDSMPAHNARGRPLRQIPGTTPAPLALDAGCAFRPRCARATPACAVMPALTTAGGHAVRCHHPHREHYLIEHAEVTT